MRLTFAPLFPIATAILGGCILQLEYKKEIACEKGKPSRKASIIMLLALLSYVIFIVMDNGVALQLYGTIDPPLEFKIPLCIAFITDGIAQLMFDTACILLLYPLITAKYPATIWLAILPAVAMFCIDCASAATLFSPRLAYLLNFDTFRRVTAILVALSRCGLQSLLCFLSSMAKIKKSSSARIPSSVSLCVLSSLLFLGATVFHLIKYEFGEGLISLTWSLNFLAFYSLDRFIIGN
jgi:hypothetical protein